MVARKGEEYIIRVPGLDCTPDPRGIGYAFYERMKEHKDKLAQIYGPTGERDTFAQFLQRCIRTAIAMRKCGVTSEHFTSLCTFNHLDSCTPIVASLFLGATMAAVDPTLSLEDTKHLLKQAPPKVIFVLPEAEELIEKAVEGLGLDTKIVVYGNTKKHTPFSDFLLPSDEEATFKPIEVKNPKDTAMIFFTSGTSGLPKGICIDHNCLYYQTVTTLACGFDMGLMLAYSSPYWTVLANVLGFSIFEGTARLVYPKFDANNSWDLFKYTPTTIFFNITQVLTMLSQGRPKDLDLTGVKDICIGGGGLQLEQMLAAKKLFHECRVHAIYGQSEVPGPVTIFKPNNPRDLELLEKNPESSGTPVMGMAYKIVDPDTDEILGPNQRGELRLNTEYQLSGYHNMDSKDVWDADGWLRTGDIAYYDEDHCFYIVDRIKEMFKFQSWHIAPAVLESVLLTHPAVELALVIGIPHKMDGDHPMGIVILKKSHKNVTGEEIEKYVAANVQDRQRLRAGVKVVDSMPYTPSGKINRRKVKEMVLSGQI